MKNPAEVVDYVEACLDFLKALIWPAIVVFIVVVFRKPIAELIPRLRKASGLGFTAELDSAAKSLDEVSSGFISQPTEAHQMTGQTLIGPVVTDPPAPPHSATPTPEDEVATEESSSGQPTQTNRTDAEALAMARAREIRIAMYEGDDYLASSPLFSPTAEADFQRAMLRAADTEGVGRVVTSWTQLEVEAREFAKRYLNREPSMPVSDLFAWLVAEGLAPDGVVEVARELARIRDRVVHQPAAAMLSESGVGDFVRSVARLRVILNAASRSRAQLNPFVSYLTALMDGLNTRADVSIRGSDVEIHLRQRPEIDLPLQLNIALRKWRELIGVHPPVRLHPVDGEVTYFESL